MQAVRLPYAKGQYGMTLLLPREGKTTGDILDMLSGERLATLEGEMKYTPVNVEIPRFETNQTTQLVQPMRQMGLSSWFDGGNITGMVQNPDGTPHGVFIANAFQVARIKVNEKGTEAAAVTVFEFADGMGPDNPKSFLADHPFVYLITERSSGAVLFVGTYHGEPSADDTETGIRSIYM
jgi:serpin B